MLVASVAITLVNYIDLESFDQPQESAVEVVAPELVAESGSTGGYYQVVAGSIYDGDTLRVTDGRSETKLRFCGIDAPETDQAGGIESRDHLRSLVAQGDGNVIVVPVEIDRYGRTVAELFIAIGGEQEIHLNSQMVADGHAYHYARYSSSCPNKDSIVRAEAMAKEQSLGLWSTPDAEKPWDYRRRS